MSAPFVALRLISELVQHGVRCCAPTVLLIVALLASSVYAIARSDYVVVSATASNGYERMTADGKLRPESYVISKGQHHGNTRDASHGDARFQELLDALAPALAKQQYWPATQVETADLLIVVHWGETEIFEDPQEEFRAEELNAALAEYRANADPSGNADPGRLNEAKATQGLAAQSRLGTMRRNAELLGYRSHLDREEKRYFASEDERTMKADLAESRYFVVLMAWDYAELRNGGPGRLRWVTRMSVRSAGNRFDIALPSMLAQAAPLFGRQTDDLVRVRTPFDGKRGEVEIGNTEVVEPTAAQP